MNKGVVLKTTYDYSSKRMSVLITKSHDPPNKNKTFKTQEPEPQNTKPQTLNNKSSKPINPKPYSPKV